MWYPIFLDPEASPKVQTFLTKDLKKYPDLVLRVRTFLKAVEKVSTLLPYYKSEEMKKIEGDLHEMRIPQRRRGGVVRIYFCVNPHDSQELILLDAELKHETEPGRIQTALQRLRQYQVYLTKRTGK